MSLGILSGPSLGLESTPACKAVQARINTELRKNGYSTISEDGKCGAATCGAMQELDEKYGTKFLTETGFSAPGLCPNSTRPQKSGGGFSPLPSEASIAPASSSIMGFDQNTIIIAGIVGLGIWALMGDKKKAKAT